ncbi:ATP-binding protein [Thiohalobacter sp. IOR34]|uniref:sensor histidine kinase n=1 Tax=Thiohalobacter sp. IOR34 TaxID=3057176 RepID=UPI0025B095F3|nr:ATP-binding protein [Thiohalobacter sp. IOR34]WJW74930.1 ATP-binding protein [Thiohalobacter sp. IOR34]
MLSPSAEPHPLPAIAEQRDALSWKPLRFLTLYRLLLATLLFVSYFLPARQQALGSEAPWLFAIVSLAYLLFALATGFTARRRWPGFATQVVIQILVDIVAITLLMHASGGLKSGLGILLVLTVAAGALLQPNRMAFLFAAVATFAVFGELGYQALRGEQGLAEDATRAGLLGIALFASTALAFFLARRIRETEALAAQRGVDLANLTKLNEYVIQHLQAGILVVDAEGRIRLMNDAARQQLQPARNQPAAYLAQLSPALNEQLQAWRDDPGFQPRAFRPEGSTQSLRPRFTALGNTAGAASLIFLEDTVALAQQAQQMKLAALGRLTASIAHEIRNPLGAISHADQLLGESPNLDSADRRLTEIIRTHARRVNDIIENVLQLSRRGTPHPQAIVLADWLNEFVDDLVHCENIAPEQIEVEVEPVELQVRFDPGQLHQVVGNLLHNALRHGARDGQPAQVRLVGGLDARHCPFLDIIDQGPGIAAEDQARLFEPFFTTAANGTGLGLYLSRELCESNGAQLGYLPVTEGGSRFRINFAHATGAARTDAEDGTGDA